MNKTKQVDFLRNKTTQGTPLDIDIGPYAPPFGLILLGGAPYKKKRAPLGGSGGGARNYFLVLHTQNEAQNKNAHLGG